MSRLLHTGEPWGAGPVVAVNQALTGKTNNFGEVTLNAGATTTTLTNPLIAATSKIFFNPETANAQAIDLPRASCTEGSATLTHANNANADKTFSYLIIG